MPLGLGWETELLVLGRETFAWSTFVTAPSIAVAHFRDVGARFASPRGAHPGVAVVLPTQLGILSSLSWLRELHCAPDEPLAHGGLQRVSVCRSRRFGDPGFA